MQLKLSMGPLTTELKKFAKKSPIAFDKAMAKGGIQLLSWATNGTSKNDSSKPQIKVGFLRGSGSVFVGGKLIQVAEGYDNTLANKSISDSKRHNLAIGYNAEYAHRRHEEITANTQKDGGPKWLENHIKNDKDDLYEFIAVAFKKEMGM